MRKPLSGEEGGFWERRLKVSSTLREDLVEDVGQDAAGVVVIGFGWGIEANLEGDSSEILEGDADGDGEF